MVRLGICRGIELNQFAQRAREARECARRGFRFGLIGTAKRLENLLDRLDLALCHRLNTLGQCLALGDGLRLLAGPVARPRLAHSLRAPTR